MLLLQALASALLVLAGLSHAQSIANRATNSTQEHSIPDISLVTASAQSPPLITGAPLQLNVSSPIGGGMVLYDNATFATSCAYNDSSCVSRCSWHHDACSRTWADWWRTGLVKTMIQDFWITDTQTVHNFTQSLTVTNGYTYAMGPEVTTWTSTETVSWRNPQLQVVSTLVPSPPCNTPTFSCTRQPWCNKNACTVQGGSVELLFWPSTSTVANHTRDRTIAFASGPVTAVYKGTTLTSPSVYLEYKTAYALNGCSQTVGGSYPGAILALDPDDLFSIDARLDYFIMTTTIKQEVHTTSFYNKRRVQYNDLTGLPPASAYMAMPMCFASGCAVITPSLFHPQLVVPTQIREMDPAWATCDMDWRGSWDPPIALSEAETIVVPTAPADPTGVPPVSSRPILDGPAKATTPPEASTQPSPTAAESEYQSFESSSNPPVFTYAPLSSPSIDGNQPSPSTKDVSASASTTMSFVQVTTIVQIIQPPAATASADPDTLSTLDRSSSHASDVESSEDVRPTTGVPEAPSQQIPTTQLSGSLDGGIPTTNLPDTPQRTTMVAEQVIVVRPDGSLEIDGSIISPGSNPITISSAVYSADPAGALVIISNSPADPTTHSPTNAYEVLSEALGSATEDQPSSPNSVADPTTDPFFSLNDSSSPQQPTDVPPSTGVVVLTLDSTTLTATQHPASSGVVNLGDSSQVLDSQTSLLTIGSHTLSAAPNGGGIVIDGSTTATFSAHAQPTQTADPTTSASTRGRSLVTTSSATSSSTDLPSVQASGTGTATGTGGENDDGGGSLPSVTFASSSGPNTDNGGDGDGDDGANESGASRLLKVAGWLSWIGVGGMVLLANG